MEKNAENIKKIAGMIDHTNLNPCAVRADIEKLCAEAKKYGFASVCVNPFYVPLASQPVFVGTVKMHVCEVAGRVCFYIEHKLFMFSKFGLQQRMHPHRWSGYTCILFHPGP